MATEFEIKQFLEELKVAVSMRQVMFANRVKNTQALLDLEITSGEREQYLRDLKVANYSEGPLENDQYGTSPNWVFRCLVKNNEVYIKVNITKFNVICVSFHIAERPMQYPYKK